MKTGLIVAGLGAVLLGACNQQKPEPPADVRAFMLEHVQPTAQTYWSAVYFVSDEKGSREVFPKNDAEWKNVSDAAAQLKAFGEKLKTPAYSQGKGADWQDFSQGLIDISAQAERAALEKNRDKVFEVGANVYNVCAACHQIYLTAAQKEAAAKTGAPGLGENVAP